MCLAGLSLGQPGLNALGPRRTSLHRGSPRHCFAAQGQSIDLLLAEYIRKGGDFGNYLFRHVFPQGAARNRVLRQVYPG